MKGLLAIGEAACVSVHGANRLGTNSLTDLLVFGKASSITAKEKVDNFKIYANLEKDYLDKILERFDILRHKKGGLKVGQIRIDMQKTMQTHCGVFRNKKNLRRRYKQNTKSIRIF